MLALLGAGRFIPACAGNTDPLKDIRATTPVHPRVCGEHDHRADVGDVDPGSSPRVRGTRFEGDEDIRDERFIPACAGNTRSISST